MRKNPNTALIIVTFAFFVDYLLLLLCVPILPIYGKSLGLSKTEIGLLFSSKSITTIISNPFMGWISDRLGRRIPMLMALFVMASSTILFAISRSFWMLLFARLAQGVASSANVTSGFALLADFFEASVRSKKMGIAAMGIACGVLMGAPLGGLLYGIGGIQLPFIVVAILIALDGIARWLFLVDPPIRTHEESSKLSTDVLATFLKLIRDSQILLITFSLFFGNFCISIMEVLLPLYLDERWNLSPIIIGVLYALSPLVYTISAPLISRSHKRIQRWKIIVFGLILMGSGSILLIIVKNLIWIMLIWAGFVAVGMACIDISCNPELADIADKRHPDCYGKVYALSTSGNQLGFIIGPLIGSTLVTVEGYQFTWTIIGIILLMYVVPFFLGFFRKREMNKTQIIQDEESFVELSR